MGNVQEKLLVRRLNRGDAAALSDVYERYRDDLLRLAASMLADKSAAEDIVQDVFVKFAGAARTFSLTGSLKGFLSTCVANAARNQIKFVSRRKAVGLDRVAELPAEGHGPEGWMISSEAFDRVRGAMVELPPEQREVITLRLYGDMRFKEIARYQQTSIKTVQSRYRYALDKLRAMLEKEEGQKSKRKSSPQNGDSADLHFAL